ncbi:nucleotidyltransferase [Halobacteriales archaeon QS_8_65_32]|nr:MAG: nucleotidyltransferase [Halobacteriales archaeon QS_8_65_32]
MDTVDVPSEESPHRQAAAFARRVRDRSIEAIEDLLLFGSTAHGDRSGIDSGVDFLAIVADDADRGTVADELRDVAYDAMLEFGPVVEVHVLFRTELGRRRKQGNPFVRNALRERRSFEISTPQRQG